MLICALLLSTIALILQGILFPSLALLPFAPFVALSLMRTSFEKSLWLALFAGVWMDLISNDPIGVHALNYTLVAALLHRFKRHFLPEEPLHFSLFTAIFSACSTLLQLMLLFLFDRRVPLQGSWVLTAVVGMPIIDGFFAFCWISTPIFLFEKLYKKGKLLWLKRKRLSRTSL